MSIYTRKVQYYETDKMGISHHSNYIRWMEEARVAFLEERGLGLDRLESLGFASPVTGVSCDYKSTTTFPETVEITVEIVKFNGVRMQIAYEIRKADGTLAASAVSHHCFTDGKGRPVSLKKVCPEMYTGLAALVKE